MRGELFVGGRAGGRDGGADAAGGVGLAGHPGGELLRAIAREDQVAVAVDEARDHGAPTGVDAVSAAGALGGRTDPGDRAALDARRRRRRDRARGGRPSSGRGAGSLVASSPMPVIRSCSSRPHRSSIAQMRATAASQLDARCRRDHPAWTTLRPSTITAARRSRGRGEDHRVLVGAGAGGARAGRVEGDEVGAPADGDRARVVPAEAGVPGGGRGGQQLGGLSSDRAAG